jgi:exosortase
MVAGLALHALGFAAQQTRVSIVALLVFAWGVLRLAGGPRCGRAAVFPLGFLVFAIPLGALGATGFWLRLWVIDASAALAHAVGIGVVQNGTQLVAPDGRYHYDVVAACSGVRSLTAMAALSLLAGYLNFRTWWRRALLLALCFPLVYAGNVARITSIVFAAQWGGQAWGERAHDVMGYGVFVIVLGGVLAAAGVLRRWWPEAEEEGAESGELRAESRTGAAQGEDLGVANEAASADESGGEVCNVIRYKRSAARAWAVAAGVVGLAVAEMFFLRALATMPARGGAGVLLAADGRNPVELPAFLGTEWIGRRAEVSAVERELLPADTGYSRKNYVSVADASKQVFLSVVLSGRDRTSIHRPELCLVGQGWTIEGATERAFRTGAGGGADGGGAVDSVAGEGAAFPATVLRVRREVETARGRVVVPQLVAYWFVGGDAIVATHGRRLALDAWNRVVHARADRWAYVLMQTDAGDGEAAALARMQAVLGSTLPVFQPPVADR